MRRFCITTAAIATLIIILAFGLAFLGHSLLLRIIAGITGLFVFLGNWVLSLFCVEVYGELSGDLIFDFISDASDRVTIYFFRNHPEIADVVSISITTIIFILTFILMLILIVMVISLPLLILAAKCLSYSDMPIFVRMSELIAKGLFYLF